jgi:hypothetical protein
MNFLHKTVSLTRDIPEHRLKAGDIGAVIDQSIEGDWYQVEFVTVGGDTLTIESLTASDLRLVTNDEIFSARPITKVA